MTGARTEIVVIGGGVMGCSIAYHLARRGANVTLLERSDIPCAASAASAGGVRQQGRDLRELPLAVASIARWESLEDELGADMHYRREGHVTVTEDPDEIDSFGPWMEEQRALGLDIELVEGDDLRELIPGIAPQVVAGAYSPSDGHANPILTTQAFAAGARRFGADVRAHTTVTAIGHDGGSVTGVRTDEGSVACDLIVLAAGAWSMELAEPLGIHLPAVARAPQMIATSPLPSLLRQVVGARGRALSLKQVPSGNYVIGGGWPGTVYLDKGIAVPWYSSVLGSLNDSSSIFPDVLRSYVERVWVGIEAQTVDQVPILGALPGFSNFVVATGFSGHGFALSPIIGQVMSELIVDGKPSIEISQLGFSRFDGMEIPDEWQDIRAG